MTPRPWLVVALALGALAACSAVVPAAPDGPAATGAGPRPLTPEPARRAGSVRPEAPTAVRLPGGPMVPVRAVATRQDGVLDVPDNVRSAGWWRGGARVGDPFGSTLLAGHVDSRDQGLGAYAELLTVRPGARIELRSDHLRQRFVVRSLKLVEQGTLADDRWVFSSRGARRLTLVTCAPPYVADRGGYQKLAVVVASPVAAPVARRSR